MKFCKKTWAEKAFQEHKNNRDNLIKPATTYLDLQDVKVKRKEAAKTNEAVKKMKQSEKQ